MHSQIVTANYGCLFFGFLVAACAPISDRPKPTKSLPSIGQIWDSLEKKATDGFQTPEAASDFLVAGIFHKKSALTDPDWRSKVFSTTLDGYIIRSQPWEDKWNSTLHQAEESATDYKRIHSKTIGGNSMVTYRYYWKGTKNYDGTTRLTTVFLSKGEHSRWFVDDIYTQNSSFSVTYSYSTYLQLLSNQAEQDASGNRR